MRYEGLKKPAKPCAALRWKGMFIDADSDPSVPESNTRIFWCVYTQNCLGPDGDTVDQDICTASRSCYEAL